MKIKHTIRRLHKGLLSGCSIALAGKHAGKLPYNVINSVREAMRSPEFARSITHFESIHRADCFNHKQQGVAYPDWMTLRFAMNERLMVGISNPIAFPTSGAIINPVSKLLLESLGSLYKTFTYSGFQTEATMNRWNIGKSADKVIIAGIGGFYHWFFECLPGIIRCSEHFPEHKVLLPENRPRFVDESLAIVMGREWQERIIFSARPIKVKEAVFYTKTNGGQFVHPNDVALLKNRMLEGKSTDVPSVRLYISRRMAKARNCDESTIIDQFQNRGFQVVELEKLRLADQIALVSRASHLAGYHGAGLSHGIFCPSGSYVLELFRHDIRNDCYARLLSGAGLKYNYLVSNPDNPSDFPDLESRLKQLTS